MAEVVSSVVHEVLGRRAVDVDKPIIDYIVNVLADEDFDFGLDGDGLFDAIGELLVDSGCVLDYSEWLSDQYQMHLVEMEAIKAGMPTVSVSQQLLGVSLWRTSLLLLVAVISFKMVQ